MKPTPVPLKGGGLNGVPVIAAKLELGLVDKYVSVRLTRVSIELSDCTKTMDVNPATTGIRYRGVAID